MTLQNSSSVPQLLPALRPAPDMTGTWKTVDEDFDTAAQRIVTAHHEDGEADEVPLADLSTWAIVPSEGRFALHPVKGSRAPLVLRKSAFSELMSRLRTPADFIKELPLQLQLATLNYRMATFRSETSTTLRVRAGEVTAVVSDRYVPLDPEELLGHVRAALSREGRLSEVRVRGVAFGMVDNMRLVFPETARAIKVGDVSHTGIDLNTSSFGRSAIHFTPMVWRLVCTNGLRAPEKLARVSFRHTGNRARLREGVREAIPSALTHADGLMDQWARSVEFMVSDVQKQVEALRDLGDRERQDFVAQIRHEAGTTELPERLPLYSLVNALTASARGVAAPARRLELETMAGEMLDRQLRRVA